MARDTNDKKVSHDLWSILLFMQVPYTSNSSHLFKSLKDPVLTQAPLSTQTLTY